MKRVFIFLLSMVGLSAMAQTPVPAGSPFVGPLGYGFSPAYSPLFTPLPTIVTFPSYDASRPHRWQVKPFASLSAGYLFYNGGGMSYLSAPVGVAAFRPLNPNWTLFGAATVSPVAIQGNRLWTGPINDPNYHGLPYSSGYGLGVSTGIQGGLMYTNQDKTFSISGSVHVERSSYPVYPAAPVRTGKQ